MMGPCYKHAPIYHICVPRLQYCNSVSSQLKQCNQYLIVKYINNTHTHIHIQIYTYTYTYTYTHIHSYTHIKNKNKIK